MTLNQVTLSISLFNPELVIKDFWVEQGYLGGAEFRNGHSFARLPLVFKHQTLFLFQVDEVICSTLRIRNPHMKFQLIFFTIILYVQMSADSKIKICIKPAYIKFVFLSKKTCINSLL